MPIVHMISNTSETFPEGSYCPIGPDSYNRDRGGLTGTAVIVLYRTHHGLCLFETERNGYHDSDFYMTVWDPDKQHPKKIMFATTRGWCYPCFGSAPDATPMVMAHYEAWRKAEYRRRKIQFRWDQRKEDQQIAQNCQLEGPRQVRRLRECLRADDFNAVTRLLGTKNFRSEFRKSLAAQVRKWLSEKNPEHSTPLSYKQLAALW